MKNNLLRCAFLAALACGLSIPASAGDLKLTMQDGRVTIIAVDVPIRQILQEWARVGHTTMINADKLSGPTVTLQLIDAPERDALDILLRSASGYIAAPRAVQMAGAALYDRVTIMPTSRPPAVTASNAPPPPTFQRPPQPIDDTDEPINVQMPPMTSAPNQVVTPFPGIPPQPPQGMQLGPNGQPIQGMPMTSPRPGVLPNPTPNGVQSPFQPAVRPGPGGGGPGGPGL
jgi:hypothetical protein